MGNGFSRDEKKSFGKWALSPEADCHPAVAKANRLGALFRRAEARRFHRKWDISVTNAATPKLI